MSVYPTTCFQWSDQRYSLKQFEACFADKLPHMVMVTDGYCAPSNYYEFSSAEVYLVKELVRQPRLVVEDMVGRLLSIPFEYPIKIHVIKGDHIVDPAEKLSEIMSRNGNSMAGIDKIIFKDNETVNFEIGAVETESGHCGVMTILDIYWERYYIAHSLMEDALMHPCEVVIPIYVPISFKIAEDLTMSSDMTFKQVLLNATTLAADFNDRAEIEENKLNPEIMLFNERDEDGYEYIVPKDWLTLSRATSNTAGSHDRPNPLPRHRPRSGSRRLEQYWLDGSEKHLLDIGVPLPQSPKYESLLETQPPGNSSLIQGNAPKLPPKEWTNAYLGSIKAPMPLPMFDKRLNDNVRGRADGVEHTVNSLETAPPTTACGTLPKIPDDRKESQTLPEENKRVDIFPCPKVVSPHPDDFDIQGNKPTDTSSLSASPVSEFDLNLAVTQPSAANQETSRIRTWSDVPDDISDLSVRDVNACMRLLKVDCHFDDVDGAFLQTLSKEDFTAYYKILPTDAKKVVLFVKGWRLKV